MNESVKRLALLLGGLGAEWDFYVVVNALINPSSADLPPWSFGRR
jgi:hypothetical protein